MMNRDEKEKKLDKLLAELSLFEDAEIYHQEFWTWRQRAMRTISEIFGSQSLQVNHFEATQYVRPSNASHRAYGESEASLGQVSSVVHRFSYFVNSLKEELLADPQPNAKESLSSDLKNVFISHSSKDSSFAKEVTYLLEALGVPSDLIFNSSMPGYGVRPGEKWPESLHSAISSEGVVISLISDNYNKSAVCLCEMGAAWVLAKTYYPIVIPPLTFRKIKGVLPTIHGIIINDSIWWSALKDELEKIFDLKPIPGAKWEGKKKDILERIEKMLNP